MRQFPPIWYAHQAARRGKKIKASHRQNILKSVAKRKWETFPSWKKNGTAQIVQEAISRKEIGKGSGWLKTSKWLLKYEEGVSSKSMKYLIDIAKSYKVDYKDHPTMIVIHKTK